ncbi:hypothetical protein [Anabaena azotica]|uniref:hypothetical protein n=1 Tax=Anabaena azotica TaxID=197653 RepID=UPI0039A770F5
MKILFWLVFWFFFMPQANNFFIENWDYIANNPSVTFGIFFFCLLISTTFCYFVFKREIDTLNERLKAKDDDLKRKDDDITRLEKILKGKDDEIHQLKNRTDNTQTKVTETPKSKTIKELSNKEIAGITINIVKEIQQSIQQWENYNEKNNPTETEKQMLLMNEYFSKYLDNTIALKREISARIYPDTTEIIEGFYIGASKKDLILTVCNDLINLANKVNTKK